MVKPRSLLVTPPTPPGISLPGLVAASARLNVLGDVKSTLRSIGLAPVRPGCISISVRGREGALAARLGCPVPVVEAAATPPLDGSDASVVRWGDGAIRRSHLITDRRRVSVAAMAISPHHRAAWCNGVLDYCPESHELLIDHCARCGRTQRWLAAEGVDFCDEPGCGPLSASRVVLPNDVVDGYGLFAGICSPIPIERQAALDRLSPELVDLQPVTLIDFAMRIGLALENTVSTGRSGFDDLTPAERSRAAARGAMALCDWPHRVRSEIRSELAFRGIGDGTARRGLHAALHAAGRSIRGGSHLEELMRSALPEIHVEIGRSFVGMDGPRILGSVAARRLGVSHVRLRLLSEAGVFAEEGVLDGNYRRALYDASDVEAAAEAWEQTSPIGSIMRRLGLPRYACERIIGAGDVEGATHPYVLAREGQPRFRTASLEDYAARIGSACRSDPAPSDAVALDAAMKMVGGRLKPWRQVLHAVTRGALRAWRVEGAAGIVPKLLVRPTELAAFAALDADEGVGPRSFVSDELSQVDAMTVLNLRQIDGPRLAAAGLLRFETGTRSLLVGMNEVLDVARGHVATAEAAARLGRMPSAAWHQVARELGPPPSLAGWPREAFDRRFAGRSEPATREVTRPGNTSAAESKEMQQ
ncbi:hypothetical protein VH567_11120 [Sphingomonas sp. 4RDLI-65]|uniref:hypothetical protein n=1 Tax=Sphingomonas sp. 4RDLI-65 TaxID=3111641 RepID=UPI003C1680AD